MANLLKEKKKKKRGEKKERAKSRMLNIEVVAGGLMKLTMQVNSLLQVPVPHPPPQPRFVPLPHWLIARRASGLSVRCVGGGGGVCVCVCAHRYPCMEGLEGVIQGQKAQH